MEKFKLRGFLFDDVIEECTKITDYHKQILYLKYVLKEWINNGPRLDPNGDMLPRFPERIANEIGFREEVIDSEKQNLENTDSNLKRDFEIVTNELGIAHSVIQRYNKIKFAKVDYAKFEYLKVQQIADETRKKNKGLNYSQLGKKLGVSGTTAKRLCKYHNIV